MIEASRMRVRTAGRGDLDGVVELERRSFSNPWPREAFEQELRTDFARLLLLEIDGELAGFVDFWLVEDEVHLLTLAVRPELRGRGLGSRLLALAEDAGIERGAAFCVLEVRVSNRAARTLYERAGYRQVGRRKGYYSDTGEDALVLMRFFEEAG